MIAFADAIKPPLRARAPLEIQSPGATINGRRAWIQPVKLVITEIKSALPEKGYVFFKYKKNRMAKWKCEEKVDALYASGRQLTSLISKGHRTRPVAGARAHAILQSSDPPNFNQCLSSVNTSMCKVIDTMKMSQSVRKELNIRDILYEATAPGARAKKNSTCFLTLCTWLITHKDELVGVESINLTNIGLSDKSVNMIHFANVLRNGAALASLTHLYLDRNQIGHNGMIAFADAIKPTDEIPMGSLASLTLLDLEGNHIGDAGMTAFADAIKPTDEIPMGSLASLKDLDIGRNQIGDSGKNAFSTVLLFSGSLASLKTLVVDDGHPPALKEVCGDRGIVLRM